MPAVKVFLILPLSLILLTIGNHKLKTLKEDAEK